jgi:thiamine pyrophosphate-dependent acetolactate synthase large subunit-like protein
MWTDNLEARIAEHEPYEHVEFTDKPDVMDPRQVVTNLDEMLPENRLAVVDGGHFSRWVYQGIRYNSPDHLICRGDFSTVGLGLPMSIGAAVGTDTDTTAVLFCGDGGLMMHFQELSTAARFEVPLIIVCFNDDSLAAEYHLMDAEDRFLARTEVPNIADAAAGLGCDSHRVRNMEELEAVGKQIDHKPDGPVVVECVVDRDVQRSM